MTVLFRQLLNKLGKTVAITSAQVLFFPPFSVSNWSKYSPPFPYIRHIFSAHLLQHQPDQIQSPWSWKQYFLPKRCNKLLMDDAKAQKSTIIWAYSQDKTPSSQSVTSASAMAVKFHIEVLWAMSPCSLVGVFCCVTSYRCVRRHLRTVFIALGTQSTILLYKTPKILFRSDVEGVHVSC